MLTKLLVIIAIVGLSPRIFGQQKCLKAAWVAFDAKQYPLVIGSAQECVASFGFRADRDQAELQRKLAPPPIGAVSDSDKTKIFQNWSVNDVSAAHWLIGRAAETLYSQRGGDKYRILALEEYKRAVALSYGRVWDPQQNNCCFWSPAEDAELRLAALVKSSTVSPRR